MWVYLRDGNMLKMRLRSEIVIDSFKVLWVVRDECPDIIKSRFDEL